MTEYQSVMEKTFPSDAIGNAVPAENHEKLTSLFVTVFLWIYISSFSLGDIPWSSLCFAGGLVLTLIGAFRSKTPVPASVKFMGWTMIVIMFFSLVIMGIYVDRAEFLSIPVFSHFVLWMIAIWAGESWARFMLLYRNLFLIMAVSVIWFLLTLTVKPLLTINHMLFADNVAGLAGNINTFSYHLSIAFFLFAAPLLCKDGGFDWKSLILLVMTGLAGILAAERSTVLSWAAALFVLFFFFPVKRTWGIVAVVVLTPLVITGVGLFQSLELSEEFGYRDKSLIMRFSEKQETGEDWDRLKIQWIGLKHCIEYPMGRFINDVNWDYYAFENLDSIPSIDSVVSVHNGFLRYFIDFGIFFSIPAIIILFLTLVWMKRIRDSLMRYELPSQTQIVIITVCGALLSNYVNTMFHNGSIFREKSSTVLFYLFLALAIHCARYVKAREQESQGETKNE